MLSTYVAARGIVRCFSAARMLFTLDVVGVVRRDISTSRYRCVPLPMIIRHLDSNHVAGEVITTSTPQFPAQHQSIISCLRAAIPTSYLLVQGVCTSARVLSRCCQVPSAADLREWRFDEFHCVVAQCSWCKCVSTIRLLVAGRLR